MEMIRGKFGFIGHFSDVESFNKYFPEGKNRFPVGKTAEEIIEEMSPFLYGHLKKIKSKDGKEIEGYIAICPFLPSQFFELDQEFVMKKIIDTGRILKDLGVKIIGLGGFTSIVKDQGKTISEELEIAATTGNTYTVVAVIEAIKKVCRNRIIDLSKSKVAIIGATGSIGAACMKVLTKESACVIITARHRGRLENLKAKLNKSGFNNIEIIMDSKEAVRDADIVITVTSAPGSILLIEDFKSEAIVCDVAVPPNVLLNKARKDILYFKGGLVQLPNRQKLNIDIGLPEGLSYGCLAETMVLTFSKRFESTIGKEIPLERIAKYGKIGEKLGFEADIIQIF